MLALDASYVLQSQGGERQVAAREFYHGVYTTELAENELLTEIRIPTPAAGVGMSYQKIKRKIGDYAIAASAVTLSLSNGQCADAAIALTNVGDTALFVYDIRFESKRGNKDWRAVFEIHSESGGPVAGVSVVVNFAGQEYSGTTDSDGVFRTSWIRNLDSGTNYANAVDLVLTNFVWDPLLDMEDDTDGDGDPDDVLVI